MIDPSTDFRFQDKMNFDFHAPRHSRVELNSALRTAEANEFVRRLPESPLAYRFKHALVQDAAYESLTHHERKRLHGITARVIEADVSNSLDEASGQLAQHYAAAGDDPKTFEYAARAGDRAMHAYAVTEAVAFYTLALDAAKRAGAVSSEFIHIFSMRGRALELRNDFETALRSYVEMETIAQTRHDRPLELESYMLRANLHATATSVYDPRQAQNFAERALGLARELRDCSAECKALWNLLVMYRYAGQNELAIQYGEQALALAREYGLQERMAFILTDLGGVYMAVGQLKHANDLFEEARPVWRTLDNQPMLADNLMLSSLRAYVSGDLAQCIRLAAEGAQISRQIGNTMGQSSNISNQAGAYLEHGDIAKALRLGTENVDLVERSDVQFMRMLARTALARTYAEIGAFPEAQALAALAAEPVDQAIPSFFHTWIYSHLALVHLFSGDLRAAEDALNTGGLDPSVTPTLTPGPFMSVIVGARLALVKGNYALGLELVEKPISVLKLAGVRIFLYELLYLKALALRALGDTAAALQVIGEARTVAVATESRRMLWQIYGASSEMESELGNAALAQQYRNESRRVLEYITEHTPSELRDGFLNLPRVRAVFKR